MVESELQLQVRLNYLNMLLDNLNELFFTYNGEGFIEFVNKKTVDVLGYMPEELIGMNVLDLSFGKYQEKLKEEMRWRLEQGVSSSYDVVLRSKDSKEMIIHFNCAPILLGDKVVGGMALGENISAYQATMEALRLSEEKFAAAFRLSPEMIAITTLREGRYIDVNDVFLELFGYCREEVIGKTAKELNIWVNPQARYQVVKTLMREKLIKNFEDLFNKKSGGTWRGLCSFARLEIAGEICVLTVAADITEKRRMEEEILKVSRLESLALLAGGLAHDFNNLLTIIVGNISLARIVGMDKQDSREYILEAEKAALQARGLTQQLLTFAQGGVPIRKTTSIKEFLMQSVNFCLCGSSVISEFCIAEELWNVFVDEGQINQVINNLVLNAVQAMPDGGIIRITADNFYLDNEEGGLTLKKGQYVRLCFHDQGSGIPLEHQAKIFDPYFTTKKEGTGLGLSTSYSIIRKHGGYITCESQPGMGTSFIIYLPASSEDESGEVSQDHRLVTGYGRILFMDDELRIREMVEEMLNSLGYEVELVANGQECIDKYIQAAANARYFDAVILDMTIPGGMGGKKTMQTLREIDPQVKVIASSGYAYDSILPIYQKWGFAGVIAKPYQVEELSEVLQMVIKGQYIS
ncbi:PAS domain-containing hybrid sensor histidine kinase/response regulator [Syntrophomonas wolfei]|uniref:Stage 0 sporulation protein A homolog n=1 Tax=Syntrophomonas wolfei subsp. wolfei (strain DSM 2245B / Goettingen) TaxID=335541 RepID=Q0AV56_SYNWW|nr:PAS domain-containing sensor histidine kinase [Syntrophomonas wolfei]ABI69398.1 Signal transduction histidine kinase nitrogen specific-like protein [Syntrophomonas wolfei subsp. wolfei str. Goettingen G311]